MRRAYLEVFCPPLEHKEAGAGRIRSGYRAGLAAQMQRGSGEPQTAEMPCGVSVSHRRWRAVSSHTLCNTPVTPTKPRYRVSDTLRRRRRRPSQDTPQGPDGGRNRGRSEIDGGKKQQMLEWSDTVVLLAGKSSLMRHAEGCAETRPGANPPFGVSSLFFFCFSPG